MMEKSSVEQDAMKAEKVERRRVWRESVDLVLTDHLMIFLALLAGTIYLLARLVGVIPPYSYQVQRFVYRIEGYVQRGTEMIVKPVLFVELIKSQIKKFIKQK